MLLQKNSAQIISFLILLIVLLSGCSGIRDKYEGDKNDICYPHRDRIIKFQEQFEKNNWEDTAIGGLVGAATGAAIGFISTGDPTGAIIGAIAGGVLGGATGYVQAKMKEAKTKEKLLKAINTDITNNTMAIDGIAKTIESLGGCRIEQYRKVTDNFKGNKINKSNAKLKLQTIDDLSRKDKELIEAVIGKVETRSDNYLVSASEVSSLTDEEFKLEKLQVKKASFMGGMQNFNPLHMLQQPKRNPQDQLKTINYIVINEKGTNIRAHKFKKSKKLGHLSSGQHIQVLESAINDEWIEVSYKGKPAFIYSTSIDSVDSEAGKNITKKIKEKIWHKAKTQKIKKVPAAEKQKKSFTKMIEVKEKVEKNKKEASKKAYTQLDIPDASLKFNYAKVNFMFKEILSVL